MNRENLLAFMIWAIDTDRLSLPVVENWKLFSEQAERLLKNYTDPEDVLMYIPKCVGMDPTAFFTDYVLTYAKWDIAEDYRDYGKYDDRILNYKRVL